MITALPSQSGFKICLKLQEQELLLPSPVRLQLGPQPRLNRWLDFEYETIEESATGLVGMRCLYIGSGCIEFLDKFSLEKD